ncbi:MAG TPA: zinc ABC transporter substrate-binding protein [Nitrososphaera sp.]|jgi:zinc transport system substrate-binding protein|nr:zinc ABC transporter substrate-binding protein [Nitrososphaera sp.]
MNQSRAALAAIATLIPLAMIATVYTGRSALQDRQEQDKITVVASFYPLYEFASRVIGDMGEVSSLVPPGIEPHDWEPTVQDVSRVRAADVLVINGAGFERWADDMGAKVIANTSEGIEFNYKEGKKVGEDDDDDEHGHGDATGGGGVNPHIWLDPILAKHQIDKIRNVMASSDPANADYYNQNADKFMAEINSLDAFIRSELADCDKSDFITFHDAFIYFSERYGLRQHSIHGISPEGEILPQTMQQMIELANKLDINVIYSEDLIDSRLADTIANEIPNGKVLVLSPIEGIDKEEQAAGIGYIDKMKQNIANLKEGLECR